MYRSDMNGDQRAWDESVQWLAWDPQDAPQLARISGLPLVAEGDVARLDEVGVCLHPTLFGAQRRPVCRSEELCVSSPIPVCPWILRNFSLEMRSQTRYRAPAATHPPSTIIESVCRHYRVKMKKLIQF